MLGKLRSMTAIYIIKDGKWLLLHRKGSSVANDKYIGAAGGHFEKDELNDAKACVLRELYEELAITEDALENLQLRYITLRRMDNEVRQNYYFFANLKDNAPEPLSSNEGDLHWFDVCELNDLDMPFSARYVVEHYLHTGRHNDMLYGGIANEKCVVFTEMPE